MVWVNSTDFFPKEEGGWIAQIPTWFILLMVYFIFFQLIFGARIDKSLNKLIFDHATEYTVSARVVSKIAHGINNLNSSFLVSFEIEDKGRKNFSLDMARFNLLNENDVGILTYKEEENTLFYIDFKVQQ